MNMLLMTTLKPLVYESNSSELEFNNNFSSISPSSSTIITPNSVELTQTQSAQIFWYLSFSLMLCVAIFGNILIIWIIAVNKRMQSVTNYFLFNLSLADLLMASFNGIPNFIYMLQKDWIFGQILCMVNNFVAILTVSSCVFTMMAVSIDRYQAIIEPLKPRMTRGHARKAICTIWLSASILALPSFIFSEEVGFSIGNNLQKACLIRWPDGKIPSESDIDLGYNVFLLLITYVLPMVSMFYCYGVMSCELWRQSQIGEYTHRQQEALISKRKVVKMFVVIVTTFGLCWLPYHSYFIYQYYDGSIVYEIWSQHLYLSFYWLAMSTSMINPIVYYSMNARFRACIKQVARDLSCKEPDEQIPQFLMRKREIPCTHSSVGANTSLVDGKNGGATRRIPRFEGNRSEAVLNNNSREISPRMIRNTSQVNTGLTFNHFYA